MLTPKELRALSPEDEAQLTKIVAFIDSNIQATFDQDASCTTFAIARKAINAEVKGMTAKVREKLLSDYSKGGWNVELSDTTLTLGFKRRGRRSKAEIAAANATVTPAPEVTVVEANEELISA